MAENSLMILDERLTIGIKCGRLWDTGEEAETRELAKTELLQK